MSTQTYFIYNAEDRIHQLYATRAFTEQEKPPHDDKMANILPTEVVKFLPGLNLKTAEDLAKVRFELVHGYSLRAVDIAALDLHQGREMIARTTHRGTLLALRDMLDARRTSGDPVAGLLIDAIMSNLRKRGETQREEGAAA